MIEKYKYPKPMKIDLDSISRWRLILDEITRDNKSLDQQRKIFLKKKSDENIGG